MLGLPQILRRFRPDALILESYRGGGWEAGVVPVEGVESLWYVNPQKPLIIGGIPRNAYVGRVSPLAHRAFALGYTALFGGGGYAMSGRLSLAELTSEWIDEH